MISRKAPRRVNEYAVIRLVEAGHSLSETAVMLDISRSAIDKRRASNPDFRSRIEEARNGDLQTIYCPHCGEAVA